MSTKPTDVTPVATSLYFLPVETRIPLKFGAETVTHVTCARVKLRVRNSAGKTAEGWGRDTSERFLGMARSTAI